ncbi:MAG TPA: hypothetical protein VGG39_32085 [Polyangiaceae bacterium]|jgi:hypothetical protein
MRFAGWLALVVIAVSLPFLAATGCKSSCASAYDYTETVSFAELVANDAATVPTTMCSACGGPVQQNYLECQSTCAPNTLDDAGDTESPTCIVDACASAVLAAQTSCDSACATLFPDKDVTSCTVIAEGGTGVTCTIHEDESCK